MGYSIKDIEYEIKAVGNCADCEEIDGCYCCRKTTPDNNEVREMLKELLKYKNDDNN